MTSNSDEKNLTSVAKKYYYIANRSNTLLVVYALWAYTILSALCSLFGVNVLIKYSIKIREQTDAAHQILLNAGWYYATALELRHNVFMIFAFLYFCWIYRASANTHALNRQIKIEFSPGWSMGSYLIPGINLYWPYKAMRELWIVNVGSKTNIILSWWIFIISYFMIDTVLLIAKHLHTDINVIVLAEVVANTFGMIAAIIAIKIVTQINEAQIHHIKTADTNQFNP